jgi:hypothetical protein
MSENTENNTMQQVAEAPAEPQALNLVELTARLSKHMERLPWATSRLSDSSTPMQLQRFIVDWIVPLLQDTHSLSMGTLSIAIGNEERIDAQAEDFNEFSESVSEQVDTAIAMSRNTMMGETISLLHMHFKSLHTHLIDKIQPMDPASFALTEMHDVFVRVGLEQPIQTPRDEAESNAAPSQETSGT